MKTVKNILLIVILGFSFGACVKDIVETTPRSSVEAEINTVQDAELYLVGTYSALQLDYNQAEYGIITPGLYSDNLTHTGTFPDLALVSANNLLAENIYVRRIWRDMYSAIYRANVVLAQTPEAEGDAVAKTAIMAEAYFIRALMYFRMVNYWGGVPLALEPLNSELNTAQIHIPRSTEAEVYAQILSDLDMAIAGLDYGSGSRASKSAALMLKGKVHLYNGDYNSALTAFTDVYNNGGHTLEGTYAGLFDANLHPGEGIFQIDYNTSDANSIAFFFFPTPTGRYEAAPSVDLIAAFEAGDQRADLVSGGVMLKYIDPATGTDKPYVMRYAELLLLLAEAEIQVNGNYTFASALVNAVRFRAGVADITLDASNWMDLLYNERRLELYGETDRWFDLKRTGMADDVIRAKIGDEAFAQIAGKYALWPIPQNEINTNEEITASDQNPGY